MMFTRHARKRLDEVLVRNKEMESVMTASDVLIETLIDWGVEVVFGLPGDGINGLAAL